VRPHRTRTEPGLPYKPYHRRPAPAPQKLAYAGAGAAAATESVSSALWFGYHVGMFAATTGLLTVAGAYFLGLPEIGVMLIPVSVAGILGMPLTVAGALRRRPRGWLPIFLVALLCNAIACAPAVVAAVVVVRWL
jgi:hypothetical protein